MTNATTTTAQQNHAAFMVALRDAVSRRRMNGAVVIRDEDGDFQALSPLTLEDVSWSGRGTEYTIVATVEEYSDPTGVSYADYSDEELWETWQGEYEEATR